VAIVRAAKPILATGILKSQAHPAPIRLGLECANGAAIRTSIATHGTAAVEFLSARNGMNSQGLEVNLFCAKRDSGRVSNFPAVCLMLSCFVFERAPVWRSASRSARRRTAARRLKMA
jgi:hypothetical protein